MVNFDYFFFKYYDFFIKIGRDDEGFRLWGFENGKFEAEYYFTDEFDSKEKLKKHLKKTLGKKLYKRLNLDN